MRISKETFDTYFSCFSNHPVMVDGVAYATAEHAYHASRYADETVLEEITSAPTAKDAWAISQKYKHLQYPDFGDRKRSVMKEILLAKLMQHEEVQRALIETGTDEIVKEEPEDAYWGTGRDGKGANELGKLWMELRSELKNE